VATFDQTENSTGYYKKIWFIKAFIKCNMS